MEPTKEYFDQQLVILRLKCQERGWEQSLSYTDACDPLIFGWFILYI
jgi:hypothetical protein